MEHDPFPLSVDVNEPAFLIARLLNDVTLLLSADRSTEGKGDVSEWDLSCTALTGAGPNECPTLPAVSPTALKLL